MKRTWDTIINDVQGYLARGIKLLPHVNYDFLEALSERERDHKLCLVPSSRFELYHLRLHRKLTARLKAKQQRIA